MSRLDQETGGVAAMAAFFVTAGRGTFLLFCASKKSAGGYHKGLTLGSV
jgi:hypothetical protein